MLPNSKMVEKRKGSESPERNCKEMRNDNPGPGPSSSKSKTHYSNYKKYEYYYFESYEDTDIHFEMIFDTQRTNAYRLAIDERKDDIKGKRVMDLGCGTGILSMFCAKHDPELVIAIDNSNIIHCAVPISRENNLRSKIKFLHRDINRKGSMNGVDKVDVIVSEFMGFFLFYEGMTETFIHARDKYLNPGGILLPDKCRIELVPIGSEGLYKSKVLCWDDVYGLKMSVMKHRALKDTHIEQVDPKEIIGAPVEVKFLDLYTCEIDDVFIDGEVEFEFTRDAEFSGIAGYFSVDFTGVNNKIVLSTSPYEPATHWKQTVFFLPNPIPVKKGEKIKCYISSFPHEENPRWLDVRIHVNGVTTKYDFS